MHLHCPAEGTTKTQQCTVVDMLEFLTEVSLRQALSQFVFQGLLIPSQFSKAVVSSFVALSVAQMFETFACKRAEHISQQNLLQKILKMRNFSDIEFPVILEALQLFWETGQTFLRKQKLNRLFKLNQRSMSKIKEGRESKRHIATQEPVRKLTSKNLLR